MKWAGLAFGGTIIFAFAWAIYINGEQEIVPVPQHKSLPIAQEKEVSILATGDIMLGRYVRVLASKNGLDYPFRKISTDLKNVDFVLGNLEGPILSEAPITPINSMQFAFESSTAELLKSNNFRVLNLANNHTLDQGSEGFLDTKKYLEVADIISMGHPAKVYDESQAFLEINGHKLGFLGFNETWQKLNLEEAVQAVEDAAAKSDFVLVAIHWGEEYKITANPKQVEIAHALVDAGASVILGHHPHVVQNIEKYKGALVFYSLGNFIFDQYFSKETQEGLLVKISLKNEKANYQLIPIKSKLSQPELMNAEESGAFINDLLTRSGLAETDFTKE